MKQIISLKTLLVVSPLVAASVIGYGYVTAALDALPTCAEEAVRRMLPLLPTAVLTVPWTHTDGVRMRRPLRWLGAVGVLWAGWPLLSDTMALIDNGLPEAIGVSSVFTAALNGVSSVATVALSGALWVGTFLTPEKFRVQARKVATWAKFRTAKTGQDEWDNVERAETDEHGTADWMTSKRVQEVFVDEPAKEAPGEGHPGFIVGAREGKDGKLELLRYSKPGHFLTVAKTRGGKGVSAVIPNLLTYPHGVVVVDPKGENAGITAKHRRKRLGRNVLVMDPLNKEVGPGEAASCNLLGVLDPTSFRFISDVRQLVALLWGDDGSEKGPNAFFAQAGRELLEALVIWTVAGPEELLPRGNLDHMGKARRDLYTTFLLLSSPELKLPMVDDAALRAASSENRDPPKKSILQVIMEHSTVAGGIPGATAARMMALPDQTWGSLPQQAAKALRLITSVPLREAACGTGAGPKFTVDEVATSQKDLYLVFPPEMLVSEPELARAFIGAVIMAAMRKGKLDKRLLLLIDEMPTLGRNDAILQAAGVAAGMGITLWMIVQSLAQLKSAYNDKDAQTLIENAGVHQYLGVSSQQAAEELSSMVGDATVVSRSLSNNSGNSGAHLDPFGSLSTGTSVSISKQKRRLLTADAALAMGDEEMVLKVSGERPLRCRKSRYFEVPEFHPNGQAIYEKWKPRTG